MRPPKPEPDILLFVIACLRPLIWAAGGVGVWIAAKGMPWSLRNFLRICAVGMLMTSVQAFVILSGAINSPIEMPEWLIAVAIVLGIPSNIMICAGLFFATVVGVEERHKIPQLFSQRRTTGGDP